MALALSEDFGSLWTQRWSARCVPLIYGWTQNGAWPARKDLCECGSNFAIAHLIYQSERSHLSHIVCRSYRMMHSEDRNFSAIFFFCRISVIFRVKSAQKIKLTDRHLLQRLAPILALYVVYLLAWSLAGPSHVVEMKMPGDLKFHECSFDWWDHAILICKLNLGLIHSSQKKKKIQRQQQKLQRSNFLSTFRPVGSPSVLFVNRLLIRS